MRMGLLEAMPSSTTVHFGQSVKHAEATVEGSGIALRGRQGEALATYDLLVDASGMFSPLRALRFPTEGGVAQYYSASAPVEPRLA